MSGKSAENDNCLGFCLIFFSPFLNISSCTTIQYNTIHCTALRWAEAVVPIMHAKALAAMCAYVRTYQG